MAHAGKVGPLHFRRDLSMQVFNNRVGLPAIVSVQWSIATGSVGAALVGVRSILRVVPPSPGFLLKWSKGPTVIAGRNITQLIDGKLDSGNPVRFIGRLQIRDSILGLLNEINIWGPVSQYSSNNYGQQMVAPFPAIFNFQFPSRVLIDQGTWAEV